MNLFIYPSPIGYLQIEDDGQAVTSVAMLKEQTAIVATPQTDFQKYVAKQLCGYFSGELCHFSLPIRLEGTPFEIRVWEALLTIPYGETRTYAQIAVAVGNPLACRAVGRACQRNPLLVLVPCHRVVGKNNALTGFACGLEAKRFLLTLEHKKNSLFSSPKR